MQTTAIRRLFGVCIFINTPSKILSAMTKKEYRVLTFRPSRMQVYEIKTPEQAFEEFFSSYNLADGREMLSILFERSISTGHHEPADNESPGNLLFFCQQVEMLMEAAWLQKNRRCK
jgi:hypothetical protein